MTISSLALSSSAICEFTRETNHPGLFGNVAIFICVLSIAVPFVILSSTTLLSKNDPSLPRQLSHKKCSRNVVHQAPNAAATARARVLSQTLRDRFLSG